MLGVATSEIAKFPKTPGDLCWSFSEAVVSSPATLYTDGRFHPSEALNDIWQLLFAHQIRGMAEEEDEATGIAKKILLQTDGVGLRYRVRLKGRNVFA